MSYSSYQEESPRDKAMRLLLELSLEQRKSHPDIDTITHIKWKLGAFVPKDLISAFDEVVDKHGWGDRRKNVYPI